MNVSVSGCLSLSISPVMDWRLVQGASCLLPHDSWVRLYNQEQVKFNFHKITAH